MTKKHIKYWVIGTAGVVGLVVVYKIIQRRAVASATLIKNQQLASAAGTGTKPGIGTAGSNPSVPLSTAGGSILPYAPLSPIGLANPDPGDSTIQVNAPIIMSQGALAGQ